MMLSLLDIAVKKCGEESQLETCTVIFAGSKSVGKSTMIQRFLEKNEPVKETLSLEYSFARKSGRSLNKDVCHIWELGGGALFTSLLPTVLGSTTSDITLVLVLDLTAPNTLWLTMESILQSVYNHFKKSEYSEVMKTAAKRIPDSHEDKDLLSPFPIPLVIVGGKYDQFLNMDPEKKKNISRTLRAVAHFLAASLIFYSDKDSGQVKKLKDILNFHGFSGTQWKGLMLEDNKPLLIPCGADSFQEIRMSVPRGQKSTGLGLDSFKHGFTSVFPQETDSNTIPDDPAKDANFREPIIDNLRIQRDEELDRFIHENEQRKKIMS